jgi:hypothetical protein
MNVGQSVRTIENQKPRGMEGVLRNEHQTNPCRWGVIGEVITVNDEHGLIYEVRHNDKTTAWYEPAELMRVL